ncbi:MAG: extracellular solute-binding protein [Candidatus Limnocylindrales bacterium]
MPPRSSMRVGSAAALALALAIPMGGAMAQDGASITMLTPSWGVPPDPDLLAAFEEESGITVEIIGGEGVALDKLFTDVVTANATNQAAADVIFLTEEAPSNVVAIGGVEDISDLVEANGTDLGQFDQVDFWQDGDALYGIPVYSQLVMMDYNAARYAEGGFEAPPTTWAELTDAARALQEQGLDNNPISFKADDWTWFILALSMGDPMFDEDLNPVFADEGSKAREAMDMLLTWVEEELISPGIISNETTQHANFWAGNAVFHQGWQGSASAGNNPETSAQAPNVEYLLLPEEHYTWSFPAAVGIGAGSENREAAYEFIEWYTGPENQQAIFEAYGLYPSRPDVAAALNESGAIEGYDVIVEQAQYLNELPRQALWWGPFANAVDEQILLGIENESSADEIVDAIAEEWNSLRSEYE